MIATKILWRTAVVCAGVALLAVSPALPRADDLPERFVAFAVNMGTPGPTGAGTVEIVVTRWSTDADRDRLMSILLEQGPEKLLDALRDMPRTGYIRTPNSIGYDLHFARKIPLPDGGERIVLATDRPIGFWEAANRPRRFDYPFTVIEIRMKPEGEGEGKMSVATKIVADKEANTIVLENYASQPVMLKSVRREKAAPAR